MATTHVIHLALLTSNTAPDISLPANVETAIVNVEIFAPGQPGFASMPTVRPVQGPIPYTTWEVDLRVAPMTVRNLANVAGTPTVNIYSDNTYVYQQQVTVAPEALFPIYFGAQSLGFIFSDPSQPGMPIAVTMRATTNMVCIRDTNQPATFRAPTHPDYPAVWGLSVQLLPMD